VILHRRKLSLLTNPKQIKARAKETDSPSIGSAEQKEKKKTPCIVLAAGKLTRKKEKKSRALRWPRCS
jgi:hypothetical protein